MAREGQGSGEQGSHWSRVGVKGAASGFRGNIVFHTYIYEERVSTKEDAENAEERRDTMRCGHSGKEWKGS